MRQSDFTSLLAAVEYRIDQVANAHERHATFGDCRRHAYRPAVGLRYAEGQLVALTRVRRLLRRAPATEGATEEMYLRQELQRWGGLLAGAQHADQPAVVWQEYARGGIDAILALLSNLDPSQPT